MNIVHKRVFFAYGRNALGEFVIWEEQAEMVRYIFAIYACGHSLAFIANKMKTLGISSSTNNPIFWWQIINNVLENEKYLGTEYYPKIVENKVFEQFIRIKLGNAYSVWNHGLSEGINQL